MQANELHIITDENLQEILPQFSYDFPLAVYGGNMDKVFTGDGPTMIPWHWHREFEINITGIREEIMCFGEQSVTLRPGEGLFINANTLHMSKQVAKGGMHTSIVFNSSMFNGHPQSVIERKYVLPIVNCERLQGLKLSHEVDWQSTVLDACQEIAAAFKKKEYGFELEIQRKLLMVWFEFVQNTKGIVEASKNRKTSLDDHRIKTMMLYIQAHYHLNPTLPEIAASANLSVSECCRCFKRVLSMTPFAYLIQYRLETAVRLLRNSDKTISEIAHDVGFDTESYFSRKFKYIYGATPSVYRKNPSPEEVRNS